MDQRKIGLLLKELRKDKGITQEQLAEVLHVSNRTVSRWETGSNMPDLDLLIELADYYEVEIREIIEGERKSEKMNKETRDTLQKVADYANEEKAILLKRMRIISIIGLFSFILGIVMLLSRPMPSLPVYDFVFGGCIGVSLGVMIAMVLYTTGVLAKLKSEKSKQMKIILIVFAVILILLFGASIIASVI